MKIVPWRNRGELTPVRDEFEELFKRFFDRGMDSRLPAAFERATVPPVNVAETEKNWQITLDLPGLDEKDIQVQLMGRQLVVSGERKWEAEKKGKDAAVKDGARESRVLTATDAFGRQRVPRKKAGRSMTNGKRVLKTA